MPKQIKKTIIVSTLFIVLTGVAFSVYAYILPGPYILKNMIENLGKAKRLEVTQEVIFYDGSPLGGDAEGMETVRYIFPDTFRSDLTYKSNERIHVVSKGEDLTLEDGSISTASETWTDMYKDVLLYRSRKSLEEQLLFRRVSISVSSFGRFAGTPAYVLGAMYPDETEPQVWFMKDSFHPIRWIVRPKGEKGSNDTLEIRYQEWTQTDENWYPMHITFHRNGILVKEIKVKSVTVDPPLSKELFDIRRLKSMYK